ncbi:MAG: hypothetical protein HRU41_42305 [Saprospiraceae bacterium]|nr:hypothetical protein [Saprospiraceae bacterium]
MELPKVEDAYNKILDTIQDSPTGQNLWNESVADVFRGPAFATRRSEIEAKYKDDPDAEEKIGQELSDIANLEMFDKISRNIDAARSGTDNKELSQLTEAMFQGTNKNGIVDSIGGFLRKDDYVGIVTNNGSPTLVRAFIKYHISKLDPDMAPKVDQIPIIFQDFAKSTEVPARGKNQHIEAVVPYLRQFGPIQKIILVDDLPANIRAAKNSIYRFRGLAGNDKLEIETIQPGRQTRHDDLTRKSYVEEQEGLDAKAADRLRELTGQ